MDHALNISRWLLSGLDHGFAVDLDSRLDKGVVRRQESLRSTHYVALARKTAPVSADNGVPLLMASEHGTDVQWLPKLQRQSEVERQRWCGSLLLRYDVIKAKHVVNAGDRRLLGKSEQVLCAVLQVVALS